ncbi:tetratricopeptide repeat protein [Myxococcota bacterium]|nr:tetratricopeptide repeat protein [Myxococcota bacterium]
MRWIPLGLALLLGACGEPRFDGLAQALAENDRGRALLDAGDPAGAAEAFARAITLDPASAELELWRARALAAAGDLPGAIDATSAALRKRSGDGVALYNRACYRARLGETEKAMIDLDAALATGAVSAQRAARDPDLQALRDDPLTRDRAPRPTLRCAAELPSEPVFIGAPLTLTVRAAFERGGALDVADLGERSALFRLARALEEVETEGDLTRVELSYELRPVAPGEGSLGPLRVTVNELVCEVAPLPFTVLGPEGFIPPALGLGPDLSPPSALVAGLALPGFTRRGARILARAEAGDELLLSPTPETITRLELRERGLTRWVGVDAHTAAPTQVTVRRGGETLLEETR